MKALLALLLACTPLAVPAACLDYAPAVVTLSGRVTDRMFYGPPNFGEDPAHDAKEHQPLLVLDRPICTTESADAFDAAETDQDEVTLVPFDLDLRPYLGKHVRVSGTLFHAMTAHHHTAVLIEIRTLPTLLPMPRSHAPRAATRHGKS